MSKALGTVIAVCQFWRLVAEPRCMLRSAGHIRFRFRQQRTFNKFHISKMLPSKEGQENKEEGEAKLPNLYSLDRPKDVLSGVTDVALSLNFLIMVLGSWKYYERCVGRSSYNGICSIQRRL